MNLPGRVFALICVLALAACGGGQAPPPFATINAAPDAGLATAGAAAAAMAAGAKTLPQRRAQTLADGNAASALEAANDLMDYAEVHYAGFFPGHPSTDSALGYLYRFYPATGIYLGVKDAQVYVLGGAFGTEVVPVGALAQFITPRPRSASGVCANNADAYAMFATPQASVGKNLAVTLAGCSGALTSPQWRQMEGPTLALIADKTQTLSLEPTQAATYVFQVLFNDARGLPHFKNLRITVGDGAATAPVGSARLTVRASQSVRMGGKVSVRAWPSVADGDNVKLVTWAQIEGPSVELDTRTSRLALFTAPVVDRDTVIRLRATLHTDQGQTDSDDVLILVERYLQAPASDSNAMWAGEHVPRLYAYQANGPYRNLLASCVYDPQIYDSGPRYNLCPLQTLPFLAQETGRLVPSVDQVMRRVLVSHDWLGRNFEAFLRQHDTRGDFRQMLKSVTAIVLSTQVRPSFYYAGTGAIYLDANEFWLTPEERDTVNEAPDYRSDFGNELKYATLWRYVKDNKSIFANLSPRLRVTRTLDDVHNEAGWLLYHELSHALDFLPPSAYDSLQRNLGAWANIAPRYSRGELTSDGVPGMFPLQSSEMLDLGRVQFHGARASAAQKAFTATQVAGFFSPDLATDDYSYSTPFEDIAMTLEEFLMQHRLGIRRDFAITDAVDAAGASARIVHWGQRGRVGEPSIRPRTRAIVSALTPWVDIDEIERLPEPLALRAGESWQANLAQPAAPSLMRVQRVLPPWLDGDAQPLQRQRSGNNKRLPPTGR